MILWLSLGSQDGMPQKGSLQRKLAGQNILTSHMLSRK